MDKINRTLKKHYTHRIQHIRENEQNVLEITTENHKRNHGHIRNPLRQLQRDVRRSV